MKALLTLIIIFTFSINVFSHATRVLVARPKLQMNLSSTLNQTQPNYCFYNVYVKTSCSSPAYTTDVIGILVGDAEGNETVAILDGAYIGIFKPCTMIQVTLLGPCMGKICKMYLDRAGSDGWIPETVTAYNIDDNSPITFKFNYLIPEDHNSGFDYCHNKV